MEYKHKIGFAIDIDGTLTHNKGPIEYAKQALDKLAQNKIPYLLLTNNVHRSE
jgi:ribonucleotide monophosphatase NagD (HAD superfamily)